MTTFAFDNSELINILRNRGMAIKNQQWNKVREIEAKINELKTNQLEKFNRPCSVFMSFENEEGVQRALKFQEVCESPETNPALKQLLYWFNDENVTVEIQPASEPSDIIWENRHFTPRQRFRKSVITVNVIGFALFCSFITIFWGRKI